MDPWLAAARATALLHIAVILFMVFGAAVCYRRPRLRWLHLAAIVNGVGIVVFRWTCPLTHVEEYCLARAGEAGYGNDFVMYWLERIIYPGLPNWVLLVIGLAVAISTIYLYFVRDRIRGAGCTRLGAV